MKEHEARRLVYARSEGLCERCFVAAATDYSHRQNRSQGGDWSPANGMHLCHECHMWIHANPNAANETGMYLRSWQDPATEPVLSGNCWVFLNNDGTYRNADKEWSGA